LDLGSYFTQQPWYRLGLSDYWEEVGVITPTWNDVLVQVFGYPRPGKLALVHAQIEALSPGDFPKNLHSTLTKSSHLCSFLKSCVLIRSNVAIGTHKHVPGVIGKQIHQNEAGISSKNNESVLVRTLRCQAKRTLVFLGLLSILDVNQAMRSPKPLIVIWYSWQKLRSGQLNLLLRLNSFKNQSNSFIDGYPVHLFT
jgi:hypothetical protein